MAADCPTSRGSPAKSTFSNNSLKLVTWSCNGLFVHPGYSVPGRLEKLRTVQNLFSKADVIALQEVHGDFNDLLELQRVIPGATLFGTFFKDASNRGG